MAAGGKAGKTPSEQVLTLTLTLTLILTLILTLALALTLTFTRTRTERAGVDPHARAARRAAGR